ncbi:hypothetical protein ABIE67_000680 [Streptomyces sp. V4I8]|uniref:hypothetical protein n=1 Tax=Streptomyces sp. V4I8 TaxID=3156469 RepID=UPI0035117B1F
MADEQMVCGGELARRVADEAAAEGLVERDPAVHPVAEAGGDRPAYSANRSAVSRTREPPRSSRV